MLNKSEFIDEFSSKGYTKKDCNTILDDFLETLTEILERGDGVSFHGFGTFEARQRHGREGTHPQTHEKIAIDPVVYVKFTQGATLRQRVRQGNM